jgi:hypothetical protein
MQAGNRNAGIVGKIRYSHRENVLGKHLTVREDLEEFSDVVVKNPAEPAWSEILDRKTGETDNPVVLFEFNDVLVMRLVSLEILRLKNMVYSRPAAFSRSVIGVFPALPLKGMKIGVMLFSRSVEDSEEISAPSVVSIVGFKMFDTVHVAVPLQIRVTTWVLWLRDLNPRYATHTV